MRSKSSHLLPILAGMTALIFHQGLAIACVPPPVSSSTLNCLPNNIKADSIVSAVMISNNQIKRTTVQQTLKAMSARCQNKKLVDRTGQKIAFFQQIGCSGVPPNPQMIKQMEQSRLDLAKLKKNFRVVEMTCNPGGIPYP
jgi:hypothetical protein